MIGMGWIKAYLNEDMHKRLKVYAAEIGKTNEEVIKMALRDFFGWDENNERKN